MSGPRRACLRARDASDSGSGSSLVRFGKRNKRGRRGRDDRRGRAVSEQRERGGRTGPAGQGNGLESGAVATQAGLLVVAVQKPEKRGPGGTVKTRNNRNRVL